MNKYLIACLGNIGNEYKNTRHNIGFKIADFIAKENNISFNSATSGHIARYYLKGKTFIFLKPNTYMNLSGIAVQYWLKKENISNENLLVITDDLALPFETIRLKPKGSSGGHNGLKNIQETLNSDQYPRLRVGIGNEYSKGNQVDFVLGDFSSLEIAILPGIISKCHQMIESFALEGIERTMNKFN